MIWLYVHIVLFAIIVLIFYAYMSSMFSKISFSRGDPFQELKIAYISIKGDYRKAWMDGPFYDLLDLFDKRSYGKPARELPSIAIFYDDPSTVPSKDLRCIIGVVMHDDWKPKKMDDCLKFGTVNHMDDTIQCRLPDRSMMSVGNAVKRVFPALKKFHEATEISKNQFTALAEVYNFEKDKILFVEGTRQFGGLLSEPPKTFDY
ncbi:hypothetical protein TRFO_38886 [Tritrichomonas foetus]|uniref:GyrI-like small molecule binding domain-containing protein n=1 Tax=Tritrichomonas foetus TaxID=1144522 RepID=A0A1J4JBA4_9EUKA|nr:hypothetical protein TRFO_38886 [Tritrichomonas foetus]|eukprot:OHS94939.1 hypothetical protein TRFO_38886 [Tritrichomonas foetus]